ncbi:MAG: YbaB/EbfC family nucleoid-associated protein [Clostridia bacterium]|nr:YbaB/EbfC family nucleoid-associated protein [Clostridia bacterium]
MNNFRGGFGGGFGGANLQNLMRQAQKMQEDMQKAKQEIEETTFTASSGGGMVTISMTGNRQVTSVSVKPEIIDPDDKEMLEDLVMAAVNDCLNQITKTEKEKMPNMPAGY